MKRLIISLALFATAVGFTAQSPDACTFDLRAASKAKVEKEDPANPNLLADPIGFRRRNPYIWRPAQKADKPLDKSEVEAQEKHFHSWQHAQIVKTVHKWMKKTMKDVGLMPAIAWEEVASYARENDYPGPALRRGLQLQRREARGLHAPHGGTGEGLRDSGRAGAGLRVSAGKVKADAIS